MKWLLSLCLLHAGGLTSRAQLFENLGKLSPSFPVGNPRLEETAEGWRYLNEHPKGLASGDFDSDGHADWAVSRLDGAVVIAYGRGDATFDSNVVISTDASSFRQLIAADLNGDGTTDLAACDPEKGKLYLFMNSGSRAWAQPEVMPAWEGGRNLAAGDFNGDGHTDLIVAGPDRDVKYDWANEEWFVPVPAAPQPAHGVAYYRGTRSGRGSQQYSPPAYLPEMATVGGPDYDDTDSFPRPVYTLRTWRPSGSARDYLVAAHANSREIRIYQDTGTGAFSPVQSLLAQGKGIRTMTLGPVLSAASGQADLIVANRDLGIVEIFRGTGSGFETTPAQAFPVAGGPRAMGLVDLNQDGWLDIVVAQRNLSGISVIKNSQGRLSLSSQTSAGYSPREMITADFDEDGRTDFAVMCRGSYDVHILEGGDLSAGNQPVGFRSLDQIYPSGGDVAQLAIRDLNGDGRGDVLQLHRLSEEASIRLAGPDGRLAAPVFYKMGTRPEALSLTDANNDGIQDLVTANIGDAQGGLYAVRLGDNTGAFGVVQTYRPPADQPVSVPNPSASLPSGVVSPPLHGALFSVLSVDLDNDGVKDLLTGYYDCRGAAFKGRGDGTYISPPASDVFTLAYESRHMVSGDFDKDGDADAAVASWTGAIVVLENTGNFFRTRPLAPQHVRREYPAPSQFAGARELVASDFDGDGDLDLISATGAGVQVLLGRAGMNFERRLFPNPQDPAGAPVLTAPGQSFPVQSMTWGDFDGDGSNDFATVCKDDGCLHITASSAARWARPMLTVPAPPTDYLATGDVDGDGKADLVGTGSVLWVALSSRLAAEGAPTETERALRPRIPDVVMNEIIASNDSIPVNVPAADGGTRPAFFARRCDCVELFNGAEQPMDVTGWKLEYEGSGGKVQWPLPAGSIQAGGHRVILAFPNSSPASPWRTGFALAKEGGILRLLRADGSVADRVTYPALEEDTSWARHADGDVSWRLNHLPNPGFTNEDGGPAEPSGKLEGVDLATFNPGQPVRMYATATDDLGVIGMSIFWRRLGVTEPFSRALLYDDGMNSDGGRLDGVFSGVLTDALPAGTPVEFYLEVEDLSGAVSRMPGPPPQENDEGGISRLYTLTMPAAFPGSTRGLEISEMVASGSTLADPTGRLTNWVEIRNTSALPLSLQNIELADSLFGESSRAIFPDDAVLAPGEHRIIWARDLLMPGVLSGDLTLSGKSEELMIVRRDALGGQEILSIWQSGDIPYGQAAARIGAGGPLFFLPPTPGLPNIGPRELVPMTRQAQDGTHFMLAYPTENGAIPKVEWTNDPSTPWLRLDSTPGDGLERLHDRRIELPAAFYRIRH